MNGYIYRPKYLIFVIFFLFHSEIFCQNFFGISSSQYSGVYSLKQNPANVVGTGNDRTVHLMGIGVDIHSNSLRWGAPFSPFSVFLGKNKFDNKYIEVDYSKPLFNVVADATIVGPALHVDKKEKRYGFALGVDVVVANTITNTTRTIAEVLKNADDLSAYYGVPQLFMQGQINQNVFNQYYGTFGYIVRQDKDTRVKVGVTGKLAFSNQSIFFGSNFDMIINSYAGNPGKSAISIVQAEGLINFVSPNMATDFKKNIVRSFFPGTLGMGLGADIGFTLEANLPWLDSHPEVKVNPYNAKFGFSIHNLGIMLFKGDLAKVHEVAYPKIDIGITPETYVDNGLTEVIVKTEELLSVVNSGISKFNNKHSPQIQAFADLNVWKKFYVNVFGRLNTLKAGRRGITYFTATSLTPRYEDKNLMLALPISFTQGFENYNVGITLKYKGFFLGSENLFSWFNMLQRRTFELHTGFFIPMSTKEPVGLLKCHYSDEGKVKRFKKKKYRYK